MDISGKEKEILEAILAGYTSPAQVAEQVFLSSDQELIAQLRRLMDTVKFNSNLQQAREDVIGTAVESFKRDILQNVRQVKDIAMNATDVRTRYIANKDILDRIIGPASQKVDLRYTPSSWHAILEEFGKKDDSNDEANPGSDDVVSETESHTEEGPSSS